jgi:hypothetical protein
VAEYFLMGLGYLKGDSSNAEGFKIDFSPTQKLIILFY